MLQDLLADQLLLAITVGGQPDPPGRSRRVPDCFHLGRLVAAGGRLGVIQTLGPQQDRRPPLPPRDDILRLQQVEQVPLGGQDRSELAATRTSFAWLVFSVMTICSAIRALFGCSLYVPRRRHGLRPSPLQIVRRDAFGSAPLQPAPAAAHSSWPQAV